MPPRGQPLGQSITSIEECIKTILVDAAESAKDAQHSKVRTALCRFSLVNSSSVLPTLDLSWTA